jgi:hypothetical protein
MASEFVSLLDKTWTRRKLDKAADAPGKFEGETRLAEVLYEASMSGWQDAEEGDVEHLGWYAMFDGIKLKGIRKPVYAVLRTDNSGFVYLTEFKTSAAVRKEWSEVEAMYGKFYAEGE